VALVANLQPGNIQPPVDSHAFWDWLRKISAAATRTLTGADIDPGSITNVELAENSVFDLQLANRNRDNLMPNPTSEMGAVAQGLDPEGNGLNAAADAANARTGSFYRSVTYGGVGVNNVVRLNYRTACNAGEIFTFDGFYKSSASVAASSGGLKVQFLNTSLAEVSAVDVAFSPTTTYTAQTNKNVTAPAGSAYVQFYFFAVGSAADSGKILYGDDFYARRLIDTNIIRNNAVLAGKFANSNVDNLFPNPTSELGQQAIDTGEIEGALVTNVGGEAFAGDWYRRYVLVTGGLVNTTLTQLIPARVGDTYYFECVAKVTGGSITADASTEVFFTAEAMDTTGTSIVETMANLHLVPISGNNLLTTYNRYNFTFQVTVSSACFIRLRLRASSSSTNNGLAIAFDQLYLRKLTTADNQSTSFSDNLVPNGTFETGIQGWIPRVNGTLSQLELGTTAPEGTKVMRVTTASSTQSMATLAAFPVLPGEIYNIRVHERSNGGTGPLLLVLALERSAKPAGPFIDNTSGTGSQLDSSTTILSTTPTSGFTFYDLTYTVPASRQWVSFEVGQSYSGSSTTTFDFDMVEVRKQINTKHVKDNAITANVVATSSATGVALTATYADLITVAMTTQGGPVLVFSQVTSGISLDSTDASGTNHFRLTRDSTVLTNTDPYVHAFSDVPQGALESATNGVIVPIHAVDTPAAGTYTYKLQGKYSDNSASSAYTFPRITCVEIKK
jgi:hypothetical protein